MRRILTTIAAWEGAIMMACVAFWGDWEDRWVIAFCGMGLMFIAQIRPRPGPDRIEG